MKSFVFRSWYGLRILPLAIVLGSMSAEEAESEGPFEPAWDSMAAYRCPDWFRDAKFGIFLHWGLNSVPGYNGHYGRHMYWQEKPEPIEGTGWTEESAEVYRHHVKTYGHPTEFGYKDFIPLWKAEKFDADELAGFFKSIGARYVVPMAVHHDNFDNWNSKHHRWNSVEMGPKRDIIGEWKKACRGHGLYFGVSSHFNGGHENVFFQGIADTKGPLKGVPYDTRDPEFVEFYHERTADGRKILPSIGEKFLKRHLDLIDHYKPDLLYFDGGLPYGEYGMKIGAHFLNVNLAQHENEENGVLALKRGFPDGAATFDIEKGQADKLREMPWQTDTTINPGWFFLGNVEKPGVVDGDKSSRDTELEDGLRGDGLRMGADQVIGNLVDIVSKNGNMLLNVGQRADGSIPDVYREELKKIGGWLETNGEAIYGTRPWVRYGEGPTKVKTGFDSEPLMPWTSKDIRYTTKEGVLYVATLAWPDEGRLSIRSLGSSETALGSIKSIKLMGDDSELTWTRTAEGLRIELPAKAPGDYAVVFRISHGS